MKYYKCYDSEITGATFAIEEVAEDFEDSFFGYFALSEEECKKHKVISRIPGIDFH
jgi:hypothetical protein